MIFGGFGFFPKSMISIKKKWKSEMPGPRFISIGWATPAITCFWRLPGLTVAGPMGWALDI